MFKGDGGVVRKLRELAMLLVGKLPEAESSEFRTIDLQLWGCFVGLGGSANDVGHKDPLLAWVKFDFSCGSVEYTQYFVQVTKWRSYSSGKRGKAKEIRLQIQY